MLDYLGQGGIAVNGFTLLNQFVWVITYTCKKHDQNLIDVCIYCCLVCGFACILAFIGVPADSAKGKTPLAHQSSPLRSKTHLRFVIW